MSSEGNGASKLEEYLAALGQRPIGEDFRKHDRDKPALQLLPPVAVEIVGSVLAHGARKYAPGNWRKVDNRSRYAGAALRHIFQWMAGESIDKESGLPHLAHAACSLLFLLECEALGLGRDDRFRQLQDEGDE